MSESVRNFFMRVFFVFEPTAARFLSFFLRRKMKGWKKEGLLDSYKVRTKRIKKFHYKVDIDLDFTQEQFGNIFSETLEKMKRR